MQQEFYIGQKVRTSQAGLEKGFAEMQGTITDEGTWHDSPAFTIKFPMLDGAMALGIYLPEEIEPDGPTTPELVFDNIAKSL